MNTPISVLKGILAALILFCITDSAFSSPPHNPTNKWDGTHSANWSDAQAWQNNIVPFSTDTVIFDNTSSNPCTVDGAYSCAKMVLNGWTQTLTIGSGITLTVGGDLSEDVSSGGIYFADPATSMLVIAGNLTKTNGYFNALNGTIKFNGSDLQTVAGVTQFNNLILHSGWAVQFSENIVVDGTLTLNSGVIWMSGDTLTVANESNGSYDPYVVGTISHTFSSTGTFSYPTGSSSPSTGPGYVTVNLISGSFPATLLVTSFGSAGLHVVDDTRTINRHWTLTPTAGTIDMAILTFEFQNGEKGVNSTVASFVLGRWNGSAWTPQPSLPVNTSDPNYDLITINNTTLVSGDWTAGEPGALPLVLRSFTASETPAHAVSLDWSTVSETNTLGFYIERTSVKTEPYSTISGLIAGAGTSLERHDYCFTDPSVPAGTYYYRLKQVDLNGTINYSNEIIVVVSGALGVQDGAQLPKKFALGQNYPNPFNPGTIVQYELPAPAHVTLNVYDMLGREVSTLVNDQQQAGFKSVRVEMTNLPGGVYVYRLQAGAFTDVKKMILIK